MEFQRARSEEQREERRRSILDTATSMLGEMPVAELSLNELSRRVGLAKSNVLRYFESREAILLELLNAELAEWASDLEARPDESSGSPRERGDAVAELLASSMAARPVMCDLVSAQAGVLERNISTEVALAHKRAMNDPVQTLIGVVTRRLPELDGDDGYHVVATALLMASAVWQHSRPTEALAGAYAADPALAELRMDFAPALSRFLAVTISGLSARRSVSS